MWRLAVNPNLKLKTSKYILVMSQRALTLRFIRCITTVRWAWSIPWKCNLKAHPVNPNTGLTYASVYLLKSFFLLWNLKYQKTQQYFTQNIIWRCQAKLTTNCTNSEQFVDPTNVSIWMLIYWGVWKPLYVCMSEQSLMRKERIQLLCRK